MTGYLAAQGSVVAAPSRKPVNPFHGRSLAWLWEAQARRRPDAPFLVWTDEAAPGTWTYAEFHAEVGRIAAGLTARGVVRGARVCVHLDNCPEFLLLWFAITALGAVIVPTNTRSVADELAYFLEASAACAVVTQPDLLETVRAAASASDVPVIVTGGGPAVAGVEAFASLRSDESPPSVAVDPTDPAAVLFTSGTTSRPKGVVWTHANYLWGGKVSASHESLRSDDRHLVFLPLFHANAQIYSVMAALWAGAAVVLMPSFSARRFWPTAVEHGATCASMIPFATRALRAQPVPRDHRFRLWISAVGDPPYASYFGVPVLGIYGMTETVTHPIVGEVGLPLGRPLAMGTPACEYEIRVVSDEGESVAAGEVGALEVRGVPGVSLFLEYLDDPAATATSFTEDEWFRTGDRVRFDPEGTLTFADRDKDMLKVGGENVAASEIEAVIARVPGVTEVAVVGVPDPMLTEVPWAYVIPSAQAPTTLVDAIAASCEALLSNFKRPRVIRLVEELPRATLNKIAKHELRSLAVKHAEEGTTAS